MNKNPSRKLTVDWGREIHSTLTVFSKLRQRGDEISQYHRGYVRIEKPLEKYITGSAYEGYHNSQGFAGFGMYRYAHGAIYEGYFEDGQFHGDGTITYPKEQQLDGIWNKGKLESYSFRFADGLEFQSNWNYCEQPDRTFQIETEHGLQPPKKEILSNKRYIQSIPHLCYDTGNGYYKPQTKIIYNHEHQIERISYPNEEELILRHFRQLADIHVGYNKDLFEYWTSGRRAEIENITKKLKKIARRKRNVISSYLGN